MSDNRLLLRVSAKLMALVAALFLAYVFVAGLLEPEGPTVSALEIDVSGIAPGEAGYYTLGQRRLVVINRSTGAGSDSEKNYSVVYGRDPVYGCELALQGDPGRLKSQCAEVEYGLDGRLIRGTPYHDDLQAPTHRWTGPQRLSVSLE